MDFVSPEHLFEELPLTKEEASILDEYICDYDFTVVGKQGPEWIFSFLGVVRAELGGEEMILEDYDLLMIFLFVYWNGCLRGPII